MSKLARMAVLLVVATGPVGCAGAQAHPGRARPADQPAVSPVAAAAAGGACQLLDFDDVDATLGVRFTVAAAAQASDTFTCVLEQQGSSFPDLTLSVTPTTADVAVFKATAVRPGSTPVAGLGKVAYSAPMAASGNGGPGLEVGWLAGNGRLIVLQFRARPGTPDAELAARTPKLVALAQKIDLSSL